MSRDEPRGSYHGEMDPRPAPKTPDEARAFLKGEVERIATEHGHQVGPWLDVGHASQTGCLRCDRYAFVEILPPPGKVHIGQMGDACPSSPASPIA